MSASPANVGIRRLAVYVPAACVSQAALETRDGCAPKYTFGLGQESMAVWDPDKEDAVSMALTAARDLLRHVDPCAIGCLRVGTESLVDTSKSMKTHLMALLAEHGNEYVEGTTHVNACYGGTDALFAAVAWVQSEAWDGRLALVVCADTAVYAPDSKAYMTGGAGAVAMLVGPDAALTLDPFRVTVSGDVNDFYTPEYERYPRVDGKESERCYLSALGKCMHIMRDKVRDVNYLCFHAPYARLVQKAYACLTEEDAGSSGDFRARVEPGLLFCRRNGNMHTASLYGCLASICKHLQAGEKVALFSYGSGYVASLFTLTVRYALPEVDGLHRLDERPVLSVGAWLAAEVPTALDAYVVQVDPETRIRTYAPLVAPADPTTEQLFAGETTRQGEEALLFVDEWDSPCGTLGSARAHKAPGVLHRAFSRVRFDDPGRKQLQQRSQTTPLFPLTWSNTCRSHPRNCLYERETRGFLGVKRAAMRRVASELGIQTLQPETIVHMGRMHYYARYGPDLAEHEVDHILFAPMPADMIVEPNADEVAACKWVSRGDVHRILSEAPETLSPWFRLLCERMDLFRMWTRFERDPTERPSPWIVRVGQIAVSS